MRKIILTTQILCNTIITPTGERGELTPSKLNMAAKQNSIEQRELTTDSNTLNFALGVKGLCDDPEGHHKQKTRTKGENIMEITIKTENLTAADIFALTKGNDVKKMRDAEGETLEVEKFVIYNDKDVHDNLMTVLAVETSTGVRYATNSKTFVRNFMDIIEIHKAAGEPIPKKFVVGSGMSNHGRKYLTCAVA